MQEKMSIGPGRPGRPEKYAADYVLKAALDLYWAEGVATLSINDLVRRIGMPKPSLYRHFPSEDALQASVLLAYEATALANLNDIMCQPVSFARQLNDLKVALIAGIKGHSRGCLLFQMREAESSLGPVARHACDQVFKRYSKGVKEWLKSATRKGDVTLHTDTLTATHLFLGLITLIRNGLRDGLNEASVHTLADAHLSGIFRLNGARVA